MRFVSELLLPTQQNELKKVGEVVANTGKMKRHQMCFCHAKNRLRLPKFLGRWLGWVSRWVKIVSEAFHIAVFYKLFMLQSDGYANDFLCSCGSKTLFGFLLL